MSYSFIINPITKTKTSIFSSKGKNMLKNYLRNLKQNGGMRKCEKCGGRPGLRKRNVCVNCNKKVCNKCVVSVCTDCYQQPASEPSSVSEEAQDTLVPVSEPVHKKRRKRRSRQRRRRRHRPPTTTLGDDKHKEDGDGSVEADHNRGTLSVIAKDALEQRGRLTPPGQRGD